MESTAKKVAIVQKKDFDFEGNLATRYYVYFDGDCVRSTESLEVANRIFDALMNGNEPSSLIVKEAQV